MATWHQQQNPVNFTKTKGFLLVTDGINEMTTAMRFDSEESAKHSLAMHRQNQPKKFHSLYHDGKLIA